MAYEYSDPSRASEPNALPDVEVFNHPKDVSLEASNPENSDDVPEPGFYFAFGFPGCLWDGEPEGPFPTYEAALAAARGEG